MPAREPGEPLNKFMARFMGAKQDQKWKAKQRLAVGYAEAKKAAKR